MEKVLNSTPVRTTNNFKINEYVWKTVYQKTFPFCFPLASFAFNLKYLRLLIISFWVSSLNYVVGLGLNYYQ